MKRLQALLLATALWVAPVAAHGEASGCTSDEWRSPKGSCIHEDQLRDRFFVEAVRKTEQHWMHSKVLDAWLCVRPRHWYKHHGVSTLPEACDR